MKYARWAAFLLALYGSIMTPFALMSAYQLVHAKLWMLPVMILALTIRIGMIVLFFRLWWRYRPSNPNPPKAIF